MTDINTAPAATLAGELTTIDGEAVYRIPLTGRDGAGKFALVSPEGLARLRSEGARFLYLVSDGHKHHYVSFLRLPSRSTQVAARVIIDAPERRRVIYVNEDRLDLRTANLMVQTRKEEPRPRLRGRKAHAVNQGWQAHHQTLRRDEGVWKRPTASPSNAGAAE